MGGNYNMGAPVSNIITDHGYGEWVLVLGQEGIMTVLASLRKLKDFFMVIKCF